MEWTGWMPPIKIYCHNGSPASVHFHKAFLFQYRVGFIYGMHIDTNGVCQLPHGWQGIPLMEMIHRNSLYDLIAQLQI